MMKFTELDCHKLTKHLQQIHQKLIETSAWSASVSSEMLLVKLLDLTGSPHGFIGTTLQDKKISPKAEFQLEFSTTFNWINLLKNGLLKV